jgi:hypothetical protein
MDVITEPIDTKKIKIKKPMNLGIKQVLNLYYSVNGKEVPLITQSPVMMVPYSPIRIQSNKEMFQFDCCEEQFIKELENIRDDILQRIQKSSLEVQGKTFVDKVLQKDFGNVFRCKVEPSEIEAYDQDGIQTTCEKVKQDTQVQLIVWIKWLWISKTYYGIEYKVMQIKVLIPRINLTTPRVELDLQKYTKMIRMNIPKPAVKNKMILDGIQDTVIERFLEEIPTNKETVSRSLPAPANSNQVSIASSFLNQIKNKDFQLRKVHVDTEDEKHKKIMNKISKYVDTSRNVPTLTDIVNAKANLRKI